MRNDPKTIILANIRRRIREAIRWHKVDDGMPNHWSTENYQRSKLMKGKIVQKKNYPYYTKSDKAIAKIAEQILDEAYDYG